MKRILSTRRGKAGLPPGTPVHLGTVSAKTPRATVIRYNADGVSEATLDAPHSIGSENDDSVVTWLNIEGLHDVSYVSNICTAFGIHPLVQEDIVNTDQRPKVDEYPGHLFLIVKMLQSAANGTEIAAEQVSLVLLPNTVITFQERTGDVFDTIRDRIRKGKGVVRQHGADYLGYCLLDAIVDHYFLLLERIEDRIVPLEDAVIAEPTPEHMRTIQHLKRDIIFLRRSLWPLREMVSRLYRDKTPFIADETRVFLRDLYDHVIHVVDVLESFHEIVTGVLEIYLSSISNRMNNVMKVLTIISTIFIPLTFIAGVYGMNFLFMPELEWRYAYPAVLGVMVGIVAFMIRFFRKKGWL